jgi:hypothetical protein
LSQTPDYTYDQFTLNPSPMQPRINPLKFSVTDVFSRYVLVLPPNSNPGTSLLINVFNGSGVLNFNTRGAHA